MKITRFIKATIGSIPGIEHAYNFHKASGGSTSNARYCYSVWLRHLIIAYENGLGTVPKKIAELGPGDSLGIGISALICGAEQYLALDVIKYSNAEINLKIFDDLVKLFQQKSPIPDEKEFPKLNPPLKNYDFPEKIFPETFMRQILDEARLLKIRNAIKALEFPTNRNEDDIITYVAPWNKTTLIKEESLDMVLSQAVLQHIDDLSLAYERMSNWLKPNGLMSHEVDFKSMKSADTWYGHWEYSDLEWKLIKGRRAFYINREPHSTHIQLLKK